MATRTQQWITELNTSILKMSSLVEESLRTAMTSLAKRDRSMANCVEEQDNFIDALENEIRDSVTKTLALQQPMGVDLRFLVSAMSIAHELERVGDRALNIANRVVQLVDDGYEQRLEAVSLARLGEAAMRMLEQAINSFVYQDTMLARSIAKLDQEVDDICDAVQRSIIERMRKEPQAVAAGLHSTIIALNLERVADQAVNIAEEVVFLVDGQSIRHKWVEDMPEPTVTRAPLEGLEKHARVVNECLAIAREAFASYIAGDGERFTQFSFQVNQKENDADAIKRNVRGHLPKGIIMPIDKFELFSFVREQDKVADDAQTLVDWLSLVKSSIPADTSKTFLALFDKCMAAAQLLPPLLRETNLFFRGSDESQRTKVKKFILEIRTVEHEADAMEMSLKHLVFKTTTDPILLHHQLTTVDIIGRVANHAENAADMIRAMIAR